MPKVTREQFNQIAADYAERHGKEACWVYVLAGYPSADDVPDSWIDIGVWAASIGPPTEIDACVKRAGKRPDDTAESVSARAWATRRPPPNALAKWGLQQSSTLADLANEVWSKIKKKEPAQ